MQKWAKYEFQENDHVIIVAFYVIPLAVHLNDLDPTKWLKKQGLLNEANLPHFGFRDDGVQLWYAIKQFISNIVLHHYKTNEGVRLDKELQTWISDIFNKGFHYACTICKQRKKKEKA